MIEHQPVGRFASADLGDARSRSVPSGGHDATRFATGTPSHDGRHRSRGCPFDRSSSDAAAAEMGRGLTVVAGPSTAPHRCGDGESEMGHGIRLLPASAHQPAGLRDAIRQLHLGGLPRSDRLCVLRGPLPVGGGRGLRLAGLVSKAHPTPEVLRFRDSLLWEQ